MNIILLETTTLDRINKIDVPKRADQVSVRKLRYYTLGAISRRSRKQNLGQMEKKSKTLHTELYHM